MENTAKKIEFQPRSNLQRTLTYRPHTRWSYYILYIAAAIFLLIPIINAVSISFLGNTRFNASTISFYAIIAALLSLEAEFLIKPLAFSKIHIEPGGLTIESVGEKFSLTFDQIVTVKFSYIQHLGGWFTIVLKSGKRLRFTVVLERSEYLLETIATARPEIILNEKLLKYRRTAILADHSWARFYAIFKSWPDLLLRFVAFPIALASIIFLLTVMINPTRSITEWSRWLGLCLSVGEINGFAGLVMWVLTELFFMTKNRLKRSDGFELHRRDIPFEEKVIRIVDRAHLTFTACFLGALVIWSIVK